MKKCMIFLLLILIVVSLTGCWSNKPIEDLNIVAAFGMDILENGLIEVSAQVVFPRVIKADGPSEDAVLVYSETGRTIFEALRKIGGLASGRPYLAHTQLFVIGESLGKEGIFQMLDFWERDHETRREATIVVTKGISAKEVLEVSSKAELIPARHIVQILENNVNVAITRNVTFSDLIKEVNSTGNELVLGVVAQRTKETPQLIKDLAIEETAVFKNDKVVGFFNVPETRGYLFTVGEIKRGILVVPAPDDSNQYISMEILRTSSKMDVKLENDKLILVVEVKEEGNIAEQQILKDLTSPSSFNSLKDEKNKLIHSYIESAIHKAQKEFKADCFGFGEIVYKKYPKLWKEIEADWDDVFSDAQVEIKVDTKVRRSGLILQPSKAQ